MEITLWLKGNRNYAEGVKLYEKHGKSSVLKNLFALGETRFNKGRLAEELTKLSAFEKKEVVAHQRPAEEKPLGDFKVHSVPTMKKIERGSLPDHLQKKDIKKGELVRKRGFLHAQLGKALNDDDRLKIADEIILIDEEIRGIWKELDGFVPGQKDTSGMLAPAPVDIIKRRNSLRSQISKQKKNTRRAAEVEQWVIEEQALTRQINEMKK